MKQLTLATAVFDRYAKTTRRAVFLAEMERVVPWSALCKLIEPFYPKPGNGRPPVGEIICGCLPNCSAEPRAKSSGSPRRASSKPTVGHCQ
jgi:hypothetical protein